MKSVLLRLLLALCYAIFSLQAIAASEFKIFTLQHRFAADLLPTIQPLVGSEGTATGMQNQLIVRTNSENMAEIEQIIANLDVERQNFKITVRHQSNLQNAQNNLSINSRKKFGDVEISTNNYPKNAPDGIQISAEDNQASVSNNSNQFINVSDGAQAFIRAGQSVPFTQTWLILTRRYMNVQQSNLQQTTEFKEITTGFSVRPRSIGNQVELEITPRIAALNQRGFIDFEELMTVVRVNRGEWFDLGGTMQQKDDVSHAILSRQTSSQSQDNALVIRVE